MIHGERQCVHACAGVRGPPTHRERHGGHPKAGERAAQPLAQTPEGSPRPRAAFAALETSSRLAPRTPCAHDPALSMELTRDALTLECPITAQHKPAPQVCFRGKHRALEFAAGPRRVRACHRPGRHRALAPGRCHWHTLRRLKFKSPATDIIGGAEGCHWWARLRRGRKSVK